MPTSLSRTQGRAKRRSGCPLQEWGQQAHHQALPVHTRDPGYTRRRQEDRQCACMVNKLYGLSMPIFISWFWNVAPMFSRSTKRWNSPASPLNNWRTLQPRVPPAGTLTFFLHRSPFFVFTWTAFSCLAGRLFTLRPPARDCFPVLATVFRPAPLTRMILPGAPRSLALISHSCGGPTWHQVLMIVSSRIAPTAPTTVSTLRVSSEVLGDGKLSS